MPRFFRKRARLSLPRLSASDSERPFFVCATSSPEIVRNFSPAASSVFNISDSAVESHASSDLPDRFLNPSTATERRTGTEAALEGVACLRIRYDHVVAVRSRASGLARKQGHDSLC